jgi:hypothetical protein
MKYVVGYRGFEIIREGEGKPFQVFWKGKLASPLEFWNFADARRECDFQKNQGRIA